MGRSNAFLALLHEPASRSQQERQPFLVGCTHLEPQQVCFSGFPSSKNLNPSGDELINEARYVADALGYDFLRSSLNRDAEPECLAQQARS